MKVLDPGHLYQLHSLDGGMGETLQFVKREGEKYPGNVGHYPGTNCQDVLRVLIDRVKYLNKQVPSHFNEVILDHLRDALQAFEDRAADVHGREFSPTVTKIENLPFCLECGHIDCGGHFGTKSE